MLNIFWVICDTWNLLIKFHKFVATNHVCGSKKFNFRSGLIMILKKCRKLICRHTRRWLNLQISTSSSWKKWYNFGREEEDIWDWTAQKRTLIKLLRWWLHDPIWPGQNSVLFSRVPGSVINPLYIISCNYMWKVSSRQVGIPLLYCLDPALPGQNFPMWSLQPAEVEWQS